MNSNKMSKRRLRRRQQLAMVAILVSSGSRETNAFTCTTGGVVRRSRDANRLALAYGGADNDGYSYHPDENDANGYNGYYTEDTTNNRNSRRSASRRPIDARGNNSNNGAPPQYGSTSRPSSPQSSSSPYDPRTSGYDSQQQQQPWPPEPTAAFGTANYDPYSAPLANSQDYPDAYLNGNYGYGTGYSDYDDAYGNSYDPYNNNYDNTYKSPPSPSKNTYKIDTKNNQEYEVNEYRYSTTAAAAASSSGTNTNDYYSRNSYRGNQVNYNYDSDYYRAIYQNQIYNRYDPAFFQANNADRTKKDFIWINNEAQKKDLQTIAGNLEYVSNTVETSVQDKLEGINDRVAETKYRWKAFLDLKDGDPYGRFCRADKRNWDFSTLGDNLEYIKERAGDVQYRWQVVQEALQQAVEVPWNSVRQRKRKESKQQKSIRKQGNEATNTAGRPNTFNQNKNATQTKQSDRNAAVLADWGSNNYSQWIRETAMNQPWDQEQQQEPFSQSAPGGMFGRLDGMGMDMELGMPLPDYYNNVQRTSMFRSTPPRRRYKLPRRPSFETPTTMRSDPKSVRSTRQWQQLQKEQEEQEEKQQSKTKNTAKRRGRQEDVNDDINVNERIQSRQPVRQELRTPSDMNTDQTRRRPPNTVTLGGNNNNSNNIGPGMRRIRRPSSTVTLPDGVDTSNVMNGRRKRPPSSVSMGGGDNRSTQRKVPASSWSPQEQNSLMRNDQGQPFAMDSNVPRRQRQQPLNSNGARPTATRRNIGSGYDAEFDPQGQYGVRQAQPNYANQNEENGRQPFDGGYGSGLPPQIQGPLSNNDDWQQQRRSPRPSSRLQRQTWQQPDQQYGVQTQGNEYDMGSQQPQQSYDRNNRQPDPWFPQDNDATQGQRVDNAIRQPGSSQQQSYGTSEQQRAWPEQDFINEQPQGLNDSMWQQSQEQRQSYGAVSQQSPESQQNYYDEQHEDNLGPTWQPRQPY